MDFFKSRFFWTSSLRNFFSSLASLWLLLAPIALFIEDYNNWTGYFGLILISTVVAIVRSIPKNQVKISLKHNDTEIKIIRGDILSSDSNIIIGFCDTLDTEIGKIIKSNSLQGQFQSKVYGGDQSRIDEQLNELIEPLKHLAIRDPEKEEGKNIRYPIGTILPLYQGKRYFLSVYTRMANTLACEATHAKDILFTLFQIWESVKEHGQNEPVSIPIIASETARSGLSRTILIEMIVLTFYASQSVGHIANELKIYVHPNDMKHVDFSKIKMFLETI